MKSSAQITVESELHNLGFLCQRVWYSDDPSQQKFTLYQKTTKHEVASVLIMEYHDEENFEIFVNASGKLDIYENLEAIKKRFSLKDSESKTKDNLNRGIL